MITHRIRACCITLLLFFSTACCIAGPLSFLEQSKAPLPAEQAFQLDIQPVGDKLNLTWSVTPGYYLYEQKFQIKAQDRLIQPINITPVATSVNDPTYGPVLVHKRDVSIELASIDSADSIEISYQGCSETGLCYAKITTEYRLSDPVSTEVMTEDTPHQFELSFLLLFYLAGLTLTMTPCLLPMIPILFSLLMSNNALKGWRKSQLGVGYAIGVAASYALIGALVGAFGASINIQASMQQAWILIPIAILLSLFALEITQVLPFQILSRFSGAMIQFQNKLPANHTLRAMIMGMLSVLILSPCTTAPLIVALGTASSTGDPMLSAGYLFILGLGLSTPLILFSTSASFLMPKPGAWMLIVQQCIAFAMLLLAASLINRLIPQEAIRTLIETSILILFASVLFFKPLHAKQTTRLVAALILGCAIGFFLKEFPALQLNQSPAYQQTTIQSVEALEQRLQQQTSNSLVYFSADWCSTCRTVEQQVIKNANVQTMLKQLGIKLIVADVTDYAQQSTKTLMSRFNILGVPSILLITPTGIVIDQKYAQDITKTSIETMLNQN